MGETALFLAARVGHESIVSLLIDSNVDISAQDKDGKTALFQAEANGCDGVVRLLIDCGADVSPKDRFRITPLHEAVKQGCDGTVRVLIDKGADISAVSKGRTALHITTGRRGRHSEAIVRQLINNGIEISAVDRNVRTALHYAAMKLNAKFARLLLELGADNSIKRTKKGKLRRT